MTDSTTAGRLKTVHIPARCSLASAGLTARGDIDQADLAALGEYLSHFATPVVTEAEDGHHVYCLQCGEEFNAFKQMMGMGVAHVWDLVHGEARCSGCGWPSRGVHRVKRPDGLEVCTLSNLFLQYHPDEVTQVGSNGDGE